MIQLYFPNCFLIAFGGFLTAWDVFVVVLSSSCALVSFVVGVFGCVVVCLSSGVPDGVQVGEEMDSRTLAPRGCSLGRSRLHFHPSLSVATGATSFVVVFGAS